MSSSRFKSSSWLSDFFPSASSLDFVVSNSRMLVDFKPTPLLHTKHIRPIGTVYNNVPVVGMNKYDLNRLDMRNKIVEALIDKADLTQAEIVRWVRRERRYDYRTITEELTRLVDWGKISEKKPKKFGLQSTYRLTWVHQYDKDFLTWVQNDIEAIDGWMDSAEKALPDMTYIEAGLFLVWLWSLAQSMKVERLFSTTESIRDDEEKKFQKLHEKLDERILDFMVEVNEVELLVRGGIQAAARFEREENEKHLQTLLELVKKSRRRKGKTSRTPLVHWSRKRKSSNITDPQSA